MNKIETKTQMYREYQAGHFGNKLQTWDSLKEFKKSGYTRNIVIRYKVASSPFCAYNVEVKALDKMLAGFVSQGADPDLFTFNELAPDYSLTMQGEVMHDHNGVNLFFSLEKGRMRETLKKGIQISGLKALMFLRHYMNPNSFIDYEALRDIYPDSVIEFSCYDHALGNLPNRNTIFWEVRNF